MQISRNIHLLNLPFTVPLPSGPVARSVNVVLVCTDTITLIDSGTAGAEACIFDYLHAIGRAPGEIKQLLLTHSHPDHIGAAQAIVKATGCTVAAHAAERLWIEDVALQERERPVPGFSRLVGGSVSIARHLDDGETVDIGEGRFLTVLHTPGHSRGSLSFWSPEENVLITGDALPVAGEMPIFDSFTRSVESLQKLKALQPRLLLSAWDSPLRGGDIDKRFVSSQAWLERIYNAVKIVTDASADMELMDLCSQVVENLALPSFAVNPLVAKSLLACAQNR